MKKPNGGRKAGREHWPWTMAAVLFAVWTFAPAAANAQRLWSVGEVTPAPDGPAVVMNGVTVGPGLGGPGGPAPPRVSAEVQVTYDYLRLGFGFLELPLPDGSTIEAENAVFKDRGDGNLMWTGEVPGAGYESVLFTVQDGHLVGWFGEPGGPKYVVHAGPDGRGSVAEEAEPAGDWCGVGAGPEELPGLAGEAASAARGGPGAQRGLASAPHGAAAADPPRSVASEANGNSLDILVLYTTGTEHFWRVIGGPTVGIRQLGDYLNMVFRNGEIPATANLIGVRWDPELFNHPGAQGGHFLRRSEISSFWHSDFLSSAEVARLRQLYEPDLIHFVPLVGTSRAAGVASLRSNVNPRVYTGWSTPSPRVFAHEIGHNLGGHHEPVTFGNRFAEVQAEAFRPYIFGHTDMTSCSKREGYGEYLLCPATIMSYGRDASLDDDPNTAAFGNEPFYSSVRHKPNGWTIGVAGTSEVERVFHETVPVAARSGAAPYSAEQIPQTVSARWTGPDTVRVAWSEQLGAYAWGNVRVASEQGGNDFYRWAWDNTSDPPVLWGDSDGNVTPLLEGDGSVVGVDVAGLQPGGGYRMTMQGPWRRNDNRTEWIESLQSEIVHLAPPRSSLPAPSGLAADVTGADSLRLRWRDNSNNETGYEVWGRKFSGEEPEKVWRRYGGRLPAGSRSADVRGLAAEEEIWLTPFYYDDEGNVVEAVTALSGRYSFVAVAYNDIGFSASETLHFEFVPGPYPAPTASGEVTRCNHRATGVDLDGFDVWACVETPDGARRRAWDYGLDAGQSGLLYFFDRDNVEVLVKVLDGCGVNGHRWVFVAPVTDLAFRLRIEEPGPGIQGRRGFWHYDSKRRPQDRIWWNETVGNPKGRTARTVSDTTAFPCTTAEVAAAKAKAASAGDGASALPAGGSPVATSTALASATRLAAGTATDCTPSGPALTLSGGYTVSMCYETSAGAVGQARDWGLDSSQSALLYFFDRNNVEVLIKVLDGCGVNGHRWVFVAPVTDLAFNLHVESLAGDRWTHRNRLGQTADAAGDTSAFPCSA